MVNSEVCSIFLTIFNMEFQKKKADNRMEADIKKNGN